MAIEYIGLESIQGPLVVIDGVTDAIYRADKNFIEVFMDRNNEVPDEKIISAAGKVIRID